MQVQTLIAKGVAEEEWPANLIMFRDRWTQARDIIADFTHKGRSYILNLYKTRYPELNDTQARLDLRAAEMVFGRLGKSRLSFSRVLAIDRLEKEAAKAAYEGDRKGMAALEAILQRYLDPANDPIDAPDWEEVMKNQRVIIMFNPELAGVERLPAERVDALREKVSKKFDKLVQDVEYEELKDNKSIKKIEEEND